MDVARKFKEKYPEADRDMGCRVLSLIREDNRPLVLDDDIEFAADSLMCEWAYVIDFDKNTFEVYKGFNKEKTTTTDRFHFLMDKVRDGKNATYYPIKLMNEFMIKDLPDEETFLNNIDGSY